MKSGCKECTRLREVLRAQEALNREWAKLAAEREAEIVRLKERWKRLRIGNMAAVEHRRPAPPPTEEPSDCPECDGTGRVHSHNDICWTCERRRNRTATTSENLIMLRAEHATVKRAIAMVEDRQKHLWPATAVTLPELKWLGDLLAVLRGGE